MAPLSFQVSAIVKMIFSSDFSILFQPFEVTRTSSLRNQLIPSAKSAERRPCPKQQVNSCPQPSAGVTGIAGIAKRRSRDTSQVQWFAKSCHVRFGSWQSGSIWSFQISGATVTDTAVAARFFRAARRRSSQIPWRKN